MKGILLIAHGDRTGESLKQTAALAEMMQEKSGVCVGYGFLRSSRPSVSEALEAMSCQNIDVLIAVPVLLGCGVLVQESIPRELGLEPGMVHGTFMLAGGRVVPLVCAGPLGACPELAALLLKRAKEAEAGI